MDSTDQPMPACPECGLTADRQTELIPVERTIIDHSDGTLTIRSLIREKRYELAERQQLLCPNGHAFAVPTDLDVNYV